MGISIYVEDEYIGLFEALSSDTRLKIIRLLAQEELNIKQIAEMLNLSTAIVTRHIEQLEKNGLIVCEFCRSTRGRQKICRLNHDSITIIMKGSEGVRKQKMSLLIGDYSKALDVKAPCGLEDGKGIKGIEDDPRYFLTPDRDGLKKLWFSNGVMQYRAPEVLAGMNVSAVRAKLRISVASHSDGGDFANIYFGFCRKVVCSLNIPASNEVMDVTVEADELGVRFNGNTVSEKSIDSFELNARDFTFEIGAGYYKSNKSVVTVYSSPEGGGIEIETVVS